MTDPASESAQPDGERANPADTPAASPPPAPAAARATPELPPPPAANASPAPAAIDLVRAQSHSLVARLDPRGTRPTVAVAAIIASLFFGAQLVNAVLPAGEGPGPAPLPTSHIDIGPLRVHLAGGWQAFEEGPAGPRIARSSVAIDVPSGAWDGDAASLYRLFVDEELAPHATGFAATDPSLVLVGPGIAGARGAYTGVFGSGEVEGQLTVVVVDGTGLVFDAWGPLGALRPYMADVELMLNTIELRQ